MPSHFKPSLQLTLLAGFLASSVIFSLASPQSNQQKSLPAQKPAAASASSSRPSGSKLRPTQKTDLPASAKRYYQLTWGVDKLVVKAVESGSMLRFSYRVLDASKAQSLNDKKATPYLYDLNTQARLEVPSFEKVGQLRQSSPVQEGHTYWMVFANQQRLVKPGTRVDVVIGPFRANGLLVE